MENTEINITCYKCEKSLNLEANSKISRQEECHHCYANLHCCKMCHFYDSSAYNECKEPMANRVLDKEKANFCDFFKLSSGGGGGEDKDNLFNTANSLFKN
ncbi:MAG: hypothetical protein K9K67_02965 [Bacteriovoracaceae bacterium]|nr:hypothetical protein [Bacteriovoracaceae bacterium]